MADFTFPSSGDTIDKTALRRAFKKTTGGRDYVPAAGDFLVSIGSGLAVNIAAGEAFVNGTWIKRDAATNGVSVAASSTVYVYASYSDAAQNTVVFGTTTTAPDSGDSWSANPERILLAVAVTGASTVTSVTDRRNRVGVSTWGSST